MRKRVKRIFAIILFLFVALIGFIFVYSLNSYSASEEMYDYLDEDESILTTTEQWDSYIYTVNNPTANIIIIPGGKVESEAYLYLAVKLAMSGYNVTIYKPIFHLSILLGNYPKKFINPNLDNIIIGHSLGGVTASNVAQKETDISTVILLGSYSINDISNKRVLSIIASNDTVLDQESYESNMSNLGDFTEVEISGGNHAQFGWYGEQNKDGKATITVLEQQNQIVSEILNFIQ